MNKKVVLLGASLLPAVSALADETPAYESAATQVQTALTAALTTITPMVVAVVVAGIGIWLVPRVVRLVKHAFSSGTGR